MKKLIWLLILSILCFTSVSAEATFKVYKGWNLINFNIAREGLAMNGIIDKNFFFMLEMPLSSNYIKIDYDSDGEKRLDDFLNSLLGEGIDDIFGFVQTRSVWVYSEKEQDININLISRDMEENRKVYLGEMYKLFRGWNLISVTPLMIGETFEDFKDSCDIEKVYVFDAARQQWTGNKYEFVTDVLSDDLNGRGMAIKVSNDCHFDFTRNSIPNLPAFPEEGQKISECTDTDNGEDYFTKGKCFDQLYYQEGIIDNCFTEEDKNYLSEGYCYNNRCISKKIVCENGCVVGEGICS